MTNLYLILLQTLICRILKLWNLKDSHLLSFLLFGGITASISKYVTLTYIHMDMPFHNFQVKLKLHMLLSFLLHELCKLYI